MTRIFDNLKYYWSVSVIKMQSILVSILLTFVYIFGIGTTRILIIFFGRKLLRPFRIKAAQESYWVDS